MEPPNNREKLRNDSRKMAVKYIGNCVDLDGEAIGEMCDNSKEIKVNTFKRIIGAECYNELSLALGYTPGGKLRLSTDYHVSFYRSRYRGEKCVYCYWSAIEYVFLLE